MANAKITPATRYCGSYVEGVDLTKPLPADVLEALRRALHNRGVLFFREQHINEAQQIALGRQFATLHIHPMVPELSPECPEIPRSIALHRVLVEEAAAFLELARAFYRAQVDRVGTLLARHGRATPTPFARRAFHTLATFGTRFLVLVVSISAAERRALANETATLFLGAGARRDPGM